MFDKFGEFDSFEEINRAAAAQLKEGDIEAIKVIAEENGLDIEDVEDFCTGAIAELATPLTAAVGKLTTEKKDLDAEGLIENWIEDIVRMCAENQALCMAVRKKGKSLEQCMGVLLKQSYIIKKQINDKIVLAAGLNPPIYLGIPGRAEAKRIIETYYLGEEK